MSWFDKIKAGLTKSSTQINQGLANIFIKKKLDQTTLDELEEMLILADIGVECTKQILTDLAKDKFDKEITADEVKQFLAKKIEIILDKLPSQPITANGPKVILVCGVNGNGKTTSIGKLAHYFKSHGNKVMLAACDTFRAAAIEQLQIWGERNNCEVIKGEANSDPASVAYQAYEQAKAKNIDILLIDTAGRLQTKANLMEELSKIIRVIKKIDEAAPHETILVLDATTGQNAHSQLEKFKEVANITSIIITKLDGTAKAGVVVALAVNHQIPIFAIGVGEKIDDLQPFSASDFARNLVGL